MKNGEQIEQLMKQLLEVEQRKKKILDEEQGVKALLLEQMQISKVNSLENASMKVNYIGESIKKTVNVTLLREKYPAILHECLRISPVQPYIRVQVAE